jgi:hypothetical protein
MGLFFDLKLTGCDKLMATYMLTPSNSSLLTFYKDSIGTLIIRTTKTTKEQAAKMIETEIKDKKAEVFENEELSK